MKRMKTGTLLVVVTFLALASLGALTSAPFKNLKLAGEMDADGNTIKDVGELELSSGTNLTAWMETVTNDYSEMYAVVLNHSAILADGLGGPGVTNAAGIAYNEDYSSVEDALDALFYTPPVITKFLIDGKTSQVYEMGDTQEDVLLAWELNRGGLDYLVLNQNGIDPELETVVINSIAATTTFELVAGDEKGADSASVTATFRFGTYSGTSAATTLTSADVLNMSMSLNYTSLRRTITYDCTGGKYPYYIYPASWGDVTSATVKGFNTTAVTNTTLRFANASGTTIDWNVVRLTGIQNGSSIEITWEQ